MNITQLQDLSADELVDTEGGLTCVGIFENFGGGLGGAAGGLLGGVVGMELAGPFGAGLLGVSWGGTGAAIGYVAGGSIGESICSSLGY